MMEEDNGKKDEYHMEIYGIDAECCMQLGGKINEDGACEGKLNLDKLISLLLKGKGER